MGSNFFSFGSKIIVQDEVFAILNNLQFGATLPQYFNNPWSIEVDTIYQNALLGIQTSVAQRSLLQECTNKGLCGYGAKCVDWNKFLICQCKAGFSGQSRVGEEAQCSRIYN